MNFQDDQMKLMKNATIASKLPISCVELLKMSTSGHTVSNGSLEVTCLGQETPTTLT